MMPDKMIEVRNGLTVLFACMLCGFQAPDALITGSAAVAANPDPVQVHRQAPGGWEILFDGTNTDKWRGKNSDRFPAEGWEVRDAVLFLAKKGAGDIITREVYGNFELVLDFN